MKKLFTEIEDDLHKGLKKYALINNTTIKKVLNTIIKNFLKK